MNPEASTPAATSAALDHEKSVSIKYGALKGKIWVGDNFDAPLPDDVLEAFENGGGPLSLEPAS
jgi:hypothetical protein